MNRLSRIRPLAGATVVALAGATALQAAAGAAPRNAGGHDHEATPDQQTALSAGLQVAPKGSVKGKDAQPNPYLANVLDATKVDYATWRKRMAKQAVARTKTVAYRQARQRARAALRGSGRAAGTVVWDEQEPLATAGSNDTRATAERITGFGSGAAKANAVRILGQHADLAKGPTSTFVAPPEDNGAITLAGDTGLSTISTRTTTSVLGDGPHGPAPAGDGTNDFDFFKVTIPAGLSLVADTSGSPVGTDTVVAAYDAAGELVAVDDDGGTTGLASLLTFTPETAGTYYLAVAGYSPAGSLPADPFDSGSGAGRGDTGNYNLAVALRQIDRDYYAVRLKPGDVIGGVGRDTATDLTVFRPDGTQMVGSDRVDASSLYPPTSPLPGGGATTMAYVAEEAGWYALNVDGAVGDYSVQLEAYRPGAETDADQHQTVYLDFDGGRVNTAIWGGPGVSELSPFSAFLGKWGIPRNRENAMIRKITAEVRENIRDEVRAGGLNPGLDVSVVNSNNHPEVKGQPNVSRILISGTIAESGINTIGISQYIDPGNYGHEDAALVLLDVLSNMAGPASLNTYMNALSDREAFVSQAVGNVTSHEIGHTVGSYHTDNISATVNLMDSGGANFQNLFGVGPDGIGGTADDANVTFNEDVYTPAEGFTGLEDTLNVTAWAYPAP